MDYHYSDRASMDKLREEGGFVETAEFSGNVYGTSKEAVRKVVEGGEVERKKRFFYGKRENFLGKFWSVVQYVTDVKINHPHFFVQMIRN